MRSPEQKKLNYILEAIRRNPEITRPQIEEKLERLARRMDVMNERGERSVETVIEALHYHPDIASLHETEHGSPQDMNGLDILVKFDPGSMLYHMLESVWIQVKSSTYGANSFIATVGEEYLFANKIVVLVGRESFEAIQESFDLQVLEFLRRRFR